MKNKIIAHLSIIMILMGVFCNVCTSYNRISVYDRSVYAAADNWTSCDSSDLAIAFRYYCKSRNLALEGSAADSLTTFTTTSFNNICSTLGIDPTTLSAQLKKTTEGNLGLRFLFSNTGITAYNRIFAEFLQNNNLAVGDTLDNQSIYEGYTGSDGSGNAFSVWIVNKTGVDADFNALVSQKGSYYKYGPSFDYENYSTLSFGFANISLQQSVTNYSGGNIVVHGTNHNAAIFKSLNSSYSAIGYPIIFSRIDSPTSFYLGSFSRFDHNGVTKYSITSYKSLSTSGNSPNITYNITNIYGDTNNNEINNNNYNNNYTIIYNDGDTYYTDDDDEPLPTTPPSGGGGGGGGDNPTNPDIPPVDPTPTPPPTIPDWDIELPEMPTGNDWLLYGLEKKFPWDIPFNLMYMLSLFAADPETPHFVGTLDLNIVQWDYDIDLAPFDDIARNVRNFEFIGFLLGLMLLTRKLIWG